MTTPDGGSAAAPPTAAAPPAAPAAPGVSLATGCQECAGVAPCDVATLELVAKKDNERKLRTTRALRGNPLSDALRSAHRPHSDFDEYDLIVEVIGTSPSTTVAPAPRELVTLTARSTWNVERCPVGHDHVLTLESRGRGREVAHGNAPATVERAGLLAAPSLGTEFIGDRQNPILGLVFGVVEVATSLMVDEIRWVATARSCAIRPPLEPIADPAPLPPAPPPAPGMAGRARERERLRQAEAARARELATADQRRRAQRAQAPGPNGDLRGLFIIYRPLKLTFKLEVRAAGETEHSHVAQLDLARSPGGESLLQTGSNVRTAHAGVSPPGLAAQERFTHRVQENSREGTPLRATVAPIKLDITLNDRAIDTSKAVEKFLQARLGLERAVNAFGDMLRSAPQLGARVDWAFTFFVCELEGGLERRPRPTPIDDRLFPVEDTWFLRGTLTVVRATLRGSLGLRAGVSETAARDSGGRLTQTSSWVDVSVQIELIGSLGGRVELSTPANTAASIVGQIELKVQATVAFRVRAIASGEFQLQAKSALKGEVGYDLRRGANGKLMLERARLVGTVTWGRTIELFNQVLWDERELWKYPSGSEQRA